LPLPDGSVAHALIFSRIETGGVGKADSVLMTVLDRDAPDEVKATLREAQMYDRAHGTIDDMHAWPSLQKMAQGVLGQRVPLTWSSIGGENRPDDWDGPGSVRAGESAITEDGQWNFWLGWYDALTAEEV